MSKSKTYSLGDYANDMPPRVFGSETEYATSNDIERSLLTPKPGNMIYDFIDTSHILAHSNDLVQDFYTVSGGRMYLDVGNIEYATPEVTTPDDLIVHERAGEVLVDEVAQNVALAQGKSTRLSKRTGFVGVKHDGEYIMTPFSLGHHENYSSINIFGVAKYFSVPVNRAGDKKIETIEETQRLNTYLVLRKLFDGVGLVDKFGYSISQKPAAHRFIGRTGAGTHTNATIHGIKPPFTQKPNDVIEIRTGEGNKSDFAIGMKYGLTSSVLRLIEHDRWPEDLVLGNHGSTLRNISYEPDGNVILKDGTVIRAIDALKVIIDEAANLASEQPNTPQYEIKALNDFYEFYADFQKVSLVDNEVSAISDRIDWAARFEYLRSRGGLHKTISTNNLDMVKHDLIWDMCGPADRARNYYRKYGQPALRTELPVPPRDTRANIRSKLAHAAFKEGNLYTINWDIVTTKGTEVYEFFNPRDPNNYRTIHHTC